ncbi:MAG: DUF721 domain-containing protein [Legionellaceae bacterium]|nr:DUF721 domain-containing protein [Legionellaceae bacterium]
MRHITRCLNPKLTEICLHAIKLEEVSAILLSYLPDNLKDHCRVGSFRNGCLTLVTHDPVWASQIRYTLPELRDTLRSEAKLYQLASIKITIDVTQPSSRVVPTSTTQKPDEHSNSPWQDVLKHLV